MKKWIALLVVVFTIKSYGTLSGPNQGVNISKVGLKLGFIKPSDVDSTIDFGFLLPLGNLYKEYMFATTVDYWSKDMGFGIDYKNISVGLRMCKHFPQVKFLDKAKIFAGIGSTLHFVEIASLSTTKIGVDTFGGFAYPLSGRLNIKTEAGYRFVTDISQMYLSATFIYKFR